MTYESTAPDIIFQSTLSVRRATEHTLASLGHTEISIHALREESDPDFDGAGHRRGHFNPRSP